MSRIEVTVGDLFSIPSDLLVLPSSRNRSVTGWVRKRVAEHGIPLPRREKALGDTEIARMPEGGFSRYVCWAASVANNSSEPGAIRGIAGQVARYAANYSDVHVVAIPLLGAGAGGLKDLVSAKAIADGFFSVEDSDAVLRLHVLDDATASDVVGVLSEKWSGAVGRRPTTAPTAAQSPARASAPPTCFVSYSWDDECHCDWVLRLAEGLRALGVETVLDRWEVGPGTNIPKFMEDAVANCDYTVLVCTPNFARKANHGMGGVGYEKNVVTGAIFHGAPAERFIPVLRGPRDVSLPTYLAHKAYVDFTDSSKYRERLEELARAIHRRPTLVPPPVAQNPF